MLVDSPDILINNAGGPPPGIWSDWVREDFLKALNSNMLTPIDLIKKVLPIMIKKNGVGLLTLQVKPSKPQFQP